MMSLKDKGTSAWGQKTVEWFVVFLLTEISVMPSNVHSGRAVPSLGLALQRTVMNLVRIPYPTRAPKLNYGRRKSAMTHMSPGKV
jgi:hypothetical protein